MDRKSPLNTIYWLVFVLVCCAFMLPVLMAKGMFGDGVIYATIARNMAEGFCTFWVPKVTTTTPVFYDHPPLVFGIESIFFRIFGDHYLVEKFYSALCFVISCFLIKSIWQTTLKPYSGYSWLPLLLWVLTPLVYWAYVNNMLENTMGIFCLGSCLCLFYSWHHKKHQFWLYVIGGLLLALGILSKGPFALFPLAIPFLYWICIRTIKLKDAILSTIILILLPVLFFAILLQWQPAHENLTNYLNIQVIASITGHRDIKKDIDHFFLIKELSNQLLTIFVIVGVVAVINQFLTVKIKNTRIINSYSLFFLLCGISASFPIMVSPKQLIHYVICSIPFYALSASAIIITRVAAWDQLVLKKNRLLKRIQGSLIVLIIAVVIFSISRINTNGRDKEVLNDLDKMDKLLVVGKDVNCNTATFYDFRLQTYLYRFYHIGLEKGNIQTGYYLTNKDNLKFVPSTYTLISKNTNEVFLYKK